ncbi:MAG: hypothetical protein ACXW36_10170, partial [Nitrospira sp.]
MTMKSRFIAHGSMVVGVLLAAGIFSGAARPPAEDRVPEAHSEKAKVLHAPFGDTRTAATDVVAAKKALYEGKGQCHLSRDGSADLPPLAFSWVPTSIASVQSPPTTVGIVCFFKANK